MNWRDKVDKVLKDHLELQIKEVNKYQEAYGNAKNKGQAQLWVAISNLSREIFNLELKLKFIDSTLKDLNSNFENFQKQLIENKKENKITPKRVIKKKTTKKKATRRKKK